MSDLKQQALSFFHQLTGVDFNKPSEVHRIPFLATSLYPEHLSIRILGEVIPIHKKSGGYICINPVGAEVVYFYKKPYFDGADKKFRLPRNASTVIGGEWTIKILPDYTREQQNFLMWLAGNKKMFKVEKDYQFGVGLEYEMSFDHWLLEMVEWYLSEKDK